MISLNRRQWLKISVMAPVCTSLLEPLSVLAGTNNMEAQNPGEHNACKQILSHSIRPLMAPEAKPLCDLYSGKVLLIVNTASKCGFTPQFEQLEKLHHHYAERGFQVLGFPSDDFRQELSSEEDIAQFCELNYGVSFPMFQKVGVTEAQAHPLYHDLAKATGTYPLWNFNKYLVDRTGRVVRHYNSSEQPFGTSLRGDIESLL